MPKTQPQDVPHSLAQFIRKRREELGLTQAQVAQAIGIRSPEFIGLVENGLRCIDLDRVPKLSDALQTDRGDLCRLALSEQAPIIYAVLFGSPVEISPRTTKGGKKSMSLTQETYDFLQKFYMLPSHVRNNLVNLVDQFCSAQAVQRR